LEILCFLLFGVIAVTGDSAALDIAEPSCGVATTDKASVRKIESIGLVSVHIVGGRNGVDGSRTP
jgi:hypothetical protein